MQCLHNGSRCLHSTRFAYRIDIQQIFYHLWAIHQRGSVKEPSCLFPFSFIFQDRDATIDSRFLSQLNASQYDPNCQPSPDCICDPSEPNCCCNQNPRPPKPHRNDNCTDETCNGNNRCKCIGEKGSRVSTVESLLFSAHFSSIFRDLRALQACQVQQVSLATQDLKGFKAKRV